MEGEEAGGANKMKKIAEIDTSAPFGSVKEAVALFGERVVAGDVCHASRLQQLNKSRDEADNVTSKLSAMTVELKETKRNLQKAIDEGVLMAASLLTLQKELEQTKSELRQLKQKDLSYQSVSVPAKDDQGKEDVKHVEDVTKFKVKPEIINYGKELEFQKHFITFADEPSLTKFIVPQGDPELERQPSLKTKKKNALIPLIGGIFSRKNGNRGI